MNKIKRGDKVETIRGDNFAGTVVAIFKNLEGEERLIVQVDPSATADRAPHIFSEDNLQLVSKYPPAKPGALMSEPLKAAGRGR